MERWIPTALAAAALLVALFGVWSQKGLDARLNALETVPRRAAPAVAAAPRAAGAKAARPELTPQKKEALKEELRERLSDALVQADEVQSSRAELARAELTAEVEAFAVEEGLDAATVGQVLGELEARSDAFHLVKQDLLAGDMTLLDARDELEEARALSDEALRRLLGDARFEILDARLWDAREATRPR